MKKQFAPSINDLLQYTKQHNRVPDWLREVQPNKWAFLHDVQEYLYDADTQTVTFTKGADVEGLEPMPDAVCMVDYDGTIYITKLEVIAKRQVMNAYGQPLGAHEAGTAFAMTGKLLEEVKADYEDEWDPMPEPDDVETDDEGRTWAWYNAFDDPWLWDVFAKHVQQIDPEAVNDAWKAEGQEFIIHDTPVTGVTYWNGHNWTTLVAEGDPGMNPDIEIVEPAEALWANLVWHLAQRNGEENGIVLYTLPEDIKDHNAVKATVSLYSAHGWYSAAIEEYYKEE